MPTLLLDLRQALRGLAKAPGFLVAAVLSLSLGIGANLATFSVLRAAFAPAVAWRSPEDLVHVGRRDADYPMLPDTLDVSPQRFRLWQENQTAVSPLAAYTGHGAVDIAGSIEPRSVLLFRVSPEFWPTLGVTPQLGRLPQGEEEGVLVVSHRFWTSALGGDPGALGQPFTAAGRPYVLVGVLPPAAVWFGGEAFVPLALTESERASGTNVLQVVGRRRTGVSEADVQAAFRTMNARLQSTLDSEKKITAVPRPLLTLINRRTSGGQVLLGWVSLFVTALACVNLCTLVLGRSASRLRELGIRHALGARPAQLFAPLFADLLVSAVPAVVLGWLFALATARLLAAFLPATLQPFHAVSPLDFGMAVAVALLLAAVGAGLPALLLPRLRVSGVLAGGRSAAGPSRQWTQNALVALQVGLALTLLSSFALVHRSVGRLREAPVGIATEDRLLATLSLPASGAAGLARRQVEVMQALEKVRALPGVEAAGGTDLLPVVSGGGYNGSIPLPGQPRPVFSYFRDATDGYFEAAGIPLLEGRTFRPADVVENPTVAIVSRSFARDYFPGQGVVGRAVPIGDQAFTIVGVVGDARMDHLRQRGDTQTFYTPFGSRRLDLVVEAPGRTQALLPELRRVLRAQWPDVSLDHVGPLGEALEQGSAGARRQAVLMGLLAALALLLTGTGIYGVLGRQVESRRREVGIRLALGGLGSQVTALVVRQAMAVVGAGLVLGLGGAYAMGRLLESQLYEVRPGDPRSHLAALVLLSATALVACLLPALRAARVDPAVVLREE